MNRAHNSEEAQKSLAVATQYFDNITIDLIYGVPNMTMEQWKTNLETVFSFGINHISSYALTVEPKTALEKFIRQGTYKDVSEEESLAHFNVLVDETQKQGFISLRNLQLWKTQLLFQTQYFLLERCKLYWNWSKRTFVSEKE